MDLSTAQTLANGVVSNLKEALSTAVPIVYPTAIIIAVLFAGFMVLKRLYHRKF